MRKKNKQILSPSRLLVPLSIHGLLPSSSTHSVLPNTPEQHVVSVEGSANLAVGDCSHSNLQAEAHKPRRYAPV